MSDVIDNAATGGGRHDSVRYRHYEISHARVSRFQATL
jgi:hypothetical protein